MSNDPPAARPRFVGIKDGIHDAGIAVIDDAGVVTHFSQNERLTRRKQEPNIGWYDSKLRAAGLEPLGPGDHIFIGGQPLAVRRLVTELAAQRNVSPQTVIKEYHIYLADHHLAHLACAWMYRQEGINDALFVILDGAGEKVFYPHYFRANENHLRSNELPKTFYSIGRISGGILGVFEVKLTEKKYSSMSRLNCLPIPHTIGTNVCGKLMGMAGYFPHLAVPSFESFDLGKLQKRARESGLTDEMMMEYAAAYKSYIRDIGSLLDELMLQWPDGNVVFGGGVALALELNTLIVNRGRNLIFSPCTNDSGLMLGYAALGYYFMKRKWPSPLHSAFLQWMPEDAIRSGTGMTAISAARKLFDGEILGVLVGNGEAGPRALGNRSLLGRPTVETAKQLSCDIKGREFYRPVAPIVTDRDFSRLFSGPAGKYMQFRNEGTSLAKQLIPGVIHRDGSARAQVLSRETNPWLYDVLVEFGKLYGAECLINTSLNCRGKPIVNTFADANREFKGLPVRLVCPERLSSEAT